MSWNVSFTGTPGKIVEALQAESARLTGPSKEEFDAALPHLAGLVAQNVSDPPGMLELDASGHATFKDGHKVNSTCAVKLAGFYRNLLTALLLAITLSWLASPAQCQDAQCQDGACGACGTRTWRVQPVVYHVQDASAPTAFEVAAVGPGRAVARSAARVLGRIRAVAPLRRFRGLLGRTRFFDGDRRPLRKAR